MTQKRAFNEGRRHFKKSKKQKTASDATDGSNESVLIKDVRQMLQALNVERDEVPIIEPGEVELDITQLSSTGDGLAEKDGQVYVVPFTAPGDKVKAKAYKQNQDESYVLADFLEVLQPSKHRTATPRCPYFTQCSGCQFQHLPYDYQLAHKRTVVEKAYKNFSGLAAELVPTVGDTIASPLQYGYRTKLTPHFDEPRGSRSHRRKGEKITWDAVPPIGFMRKGSTRTMDIEDCPIGTDTVRAGMKTERERVSKEINTYQRGATLLLRESTERQGDKDIKTCITNPKAVSTEYVDGFRLDNPAGSFFQNNNSILPLVTQYIRDNILKASSTPIKHMIDAYCGSGLFTVTLSKTFDSSIGIDISGQSIEFASKNAKLNNLSESSVKFIAGDANDLFASIDSTKFPPEETAVIIDPPRKGSDEGFIKQLLAYNFAVICYVSCNVHTQARDIGMMIRPGNYEIASITPFDFFPATSHVETIAVLRRKAA